MRKPTGYEVICYDSSGKGVIFAANSSNIAVNGASATISGLNPNTKYRFVVRAISGLLGIQSKEAKLTVKTLKM